jgi:hypothetical protein
MAASSRHEREIANVVFIALEIAAGFYPIATRMYNNVSTVGERHGLSSQHRGFLVTYRGRPTVIF